MIVQCRMHLTVVDCRRSSHICIQWRQASHVPKTLQLPYADPHTRRILGYLGYCVFCWPDTASKSTSFTMCNRQWLLDGILKGQIVWSWTRMRNITQRWSLNGVILSLIEATMEEAQGGLQDTIYWVTCIWGYHHYRGKIGAKKN